ncbi:hypothetical protein C7W88_21345 (plasmid) [Novosphingobium sp. THN1]|nr:hypothetical protein C7W88_21345 [Novosphingobium sp. THN1]
MGRACGCVVAGTLVDTPKGLVAIETLAAGDMLLAYDVKTGEVVPQSVLDVLRTEPKPTYNVILRAANGETAQFEATDDHPWLNAAKEWRNTDELTVGDRLIAGDGGRFEVIEVGLTGNVEVAYALRCALYDNGGCYLHPMETAGKRQSRPCVRCISELWVRCVASWPLPRSGK